VDVTVTWIAEHLQILRIQYLDAFVLVILVVGLKVLSTAASLASAVYELAEPGGLLPYGTALPNFNRERCNGGLEIDSELRIVRQAGDMVLRTSNSESTWA